MLDIDILLPRIKDSEDALTNIDNAHSELSREESTGIIEMLDYLINSELVQWSDFFEKPNIISILKRCNKSIDYNNSSPSIKNIFRTYYLNPNSINVMIIGMDPYPQMVAGIRVANGIPFDVNHDLQARGHIPRSLENFYEELENDLNVSRNDFSFEYLIEQGIFMINFAHTVTVGTAKQNSGSHMDLWEDYTKILVKYIIDNNKNIVIAILGSGVSYKLRDEIYSMSDRCITTGHPSRPLGSKNPFSGSKIFSNINAISTEPINWIRK